MLRDVTGPPGCPQARPAGGTTFRIDQLRAIVAPHAVVGPSSTVRQSILAAVPATRVIVIGAGVVGACVAYELRRSGGDVLVVDAGRAGQGASKGNTGWVSPSFSYPLAAPGVIRQGLRSALKQDGALVIRPSLDPTFLRWLWRFRSRCTATRFAEATRALALLNERTLELLDAYAADGVAFEMHADGLVVAARTTAGLDVYRRLFDDLRAAGHAPGLDDLDAAALVAAEPALDPNAVACGLRCRVDRFVRPESLVAGVLGRATALGVELRENVAVDAIERRGRELLVAGEVADRVVIATGVGSVALAGRLGVRLEILPAKGYSITATGAGTAPSTALYLAEAKVGISGYDGAVRIAGVFELPGRDTAIAPKRINSFVASAVSYLADWRPDAASIDSWAGLRPATPDGLPLIGEIAPGVFAATGHGMLGVTLAPATAALLAPAVLHGRTDPALAPFAPARR